MTGPKVRWLPAQNITGFWESSRCLSQDYMAPKPLFLILRSTLKVSTLFMQVMSASHVLANIDSSKSI